MVEALGRSTDKARSAEVPGSNFVRREQSSVPGILSGRSLIEGGLDEKSAWPERGSERFLNGTFCKHYFYWKIHPGNRSIKR